MSARSRTTDDFASLFRYNRWANDRVLNALQEADDAPGRATELFSHLLRSQDVWYGRVQDTDHASLDFWVRDALSQCAERAEASARRWREVLDGCTPATLDETVAYTNSSGTAFETPLRDILSHVVNHSTHHRAQIALVLRREGIAPPPTDYIYFVREE